MKYYLIAGEASGDLHASNLVKELKIKDSDAEFRGWGGNLMHEEGVHLVKHYKELAFMGFTEVLANMSTILKNIKHCKSDIKEWRPHVVIYIDYPGFNMRIAPYVKSLGIKSLWYISPQVWAWKQGRVHKLNRMTDRMFVILPFEKDFYQKFGYQVDFVGHPLLDAIAHFRSQKTEQLYADKQVVALLPGSRKQEISKMLPEFLKVTKHFPEYKFVVAGAPSQDESFYSSFLGDYPQVELVQGKTYDLLLEAKAAVVTSGTATLETALFKVPEVVAYKGGRISYYIARWLIKVKFISLVNLIMDKEVVKELIQDEMNEENLKNELNRLLDESGKNELMEAYQELEQKLGGKGASEKTATLVLKSLETA
ncbi:MAG: lipid-A-disaccharide synthase [Flavobacteriales bacterium]